MTTVENSRTRWNDGAGGLCNRSDNVTLPTYAVNSQEMYAFCRQI